MNDLVSEYQQYQEATIDDDEAYGEGDQEPNVEAGDVIIVLQEKPHEQFKRIDNDLYMVHKLTLTEALCGFNITIKHLDGRSIILNHPAGQVVQPGSKKGA